MTLVRHILPSFGLVPSGLELHGMSGIVGVAYHLAKQQAHVGWDTELVGLAREEGAAAAVRGSPRAVRRVVVRPWKWFKVLEYDFRYLAPLAIMLSVRQAADVHHVYSNPFHLALGRPAKRVLHFQTPLGQVSSSFVRAVQRADAVICCSDFIRDQFQSKIDYPAERVHTVFNGVDQERFTPSEKRVARTRLGIPHDGTVILYAGQVNEEKGLLYLVRACRILTPEYKIRLIVAGSSRLWGNIQAQGERTVYEDQVAQEASDLETTFLGKIPYADMASVYQAADVFVCPSVWDEPFGMVNLEAMASGLPVVGTCVGGIPEAIRDGETGFVVPPADDEALAEALHKLLRDPVLRQRMAENSFQRAKGFGWGTIANEVRGIYREIGAVGR